MILIETNKHLMLDYGVLNANINKQSARICKISNTLNKGYSEYTKYFFNRGIMIASIYDIQWVDYRIYT